MDWIKADLKECDHCGETTACLYEEDPYLLDIEGQSVYSWWCKECYDLRCDEI